jgi:predicted nucleotidyltransferase
MVNITMNLATRVAEHRNEILALAKKHGAENVRVFGSVAKGGDTEASDLDLLVTLGAKRTPFFPGGLKADLEALLSCEIDIVTENALHRLIRDEILADARPL